MNASLVLGQSDFISHIFLIDQKHMLEPFAVAVDGSGNIFIADTGNSRVLEFKPPLSNGMNASVVIGEPDFTTVAPAVDQTSVGVPISVSVDANGNLWVSDNLNMRVLEFQPPFVNGMKASLVLGEPDFVTGGPAFVGPSSLNGTFGAAFVP